MKIGPAPELEAPLALVEQEAAGDVAGQQVRRELDALEAQVERLREQARDQRLREPRVVLDQDVAVREHAGEDLLEHRRLADDDLGERGEDGLSAVGDGVDLHARSSISAISAPSSRRDGPRRRIHRRSGGIASVPPARSRSRGPRTRSK